MKFSVSLLPGATMATTPFGVYVFDNAHRLWYRDHFSAGDLSLDPEVAKAFNFPDVATWCQVTIPEWPTPIAKFTAASALTTGPFPNRTLLYVVSQGIWQGSPSKEMPWRVDWRTIPFPEIDTDSTVSEPL